MNRFTNLRLVYHGRVLREFFVFAVWLTEDKRLVLFPARTIVRDPHHLKSATRHEQDLNLRRN